ncbi:UTRA domain-containing protein [Catellatospora sichuanensis]|uniref:UTRA domain-containing protein n=1 Tax=Catellatospora sichuanensis TaxID=1969805 RepID=UPI001181F003|nr:UTRA domain-containing protein [Catellatospora sichuanensis]
MGPPGERAAEPISYVLPQPVGASDAWTADAAQLGRVGSQRLLEVAEVAAPAVVADVIGARVVVRRRLVLLDGQPVELADSYFPLEVAQGTGLAEAGRIRGGAPTLLAALGFLPDEVAEELVVRPATGAEAAALDLAGDSLVVELRRVTRGRDGRPYEVAVMVMRPEGRVFRYRMKVDVDGVSRQ